MMINMNFSRENSVAIIYFMKNIKMNDAFMFIFDELVPILGNFIGIINRMGNIL